VLRKDRCLDEKKKDKKTIRGKKVGRGGTGRADVTIVSEGLRKKKGNPTGREMQQSREISKRGGPGSGSQRPL